jgi:hypothetical protein
MAQPTAYNQTTDFSEYQINNPDAPFNGANHDTEYGNIETTLDSICTNLAQIQRDDGRLANMSVHPDAFDTNSRLLMATDSTFNGAWVTATAYTIGQSVSNSGIVYLCAVAHTSGTFATDLAASKWIQLSTSASALTAGRIPLVSTAGLLTDSGTYIYTDTATTRALQVAGSGSSEAYISVNNTHASGKAYFNVNTLAGDAYTQYSKITGGLLSWVAGYDYSASSYIITRTAFGIDDYFKIDYNGVISLGSATPSLNVGGSNVSTGTATITIGQGRTGNGYSALELCGDTTYSDGIKILRHNTGANAASSLLARGTGEFSVGTVEAGNFLLQSNNVTRFVLTAAGGLHSLNATGGDMGIDTINAKAVYDDGAGPLTDYVLDYAVDGEIDFSIYENTLFGAAKARLWDPDNLDLDKYAAAWRSRRALPPFQSKSVKIRQPIGKLTQALIETVEVHAVLIERLNQRTR